MKYLTPTKEIKNSTQQITSVESDIQSVKKLAPLETQCSKDFTTGKQPEPHEPTSYPSVTFIKRTTLQHYALISAKVSEVTSFTQVFQLKLCNNLPTDAKYLPPEPPSFNQPPNTHIEKSTNYKARPCVFFYFHVTYTLLHAATLFSSFLSNNHSILLSQCKIHSFEFLRNSR